MNGKKSQKRPIDNFPLNMQQAIRLLAAVAKRLAEENARNAGTTAEQAD